MLDPSQWGLLGYLIALWTVLTTVLFFMYAYRNILENKEEDALFLDKAEDHMAREQTALVARIMRLDKPIMMLMITSGVLLLVIFGVWVWEGLLHSGLRR